MANNNVKMEVSKDIMQNWQEISDVLAEMTGVPVALIMRFNDPDIEVFISSRSRGNPYNPGDREKLAGSGLYCETVIKTKRRLLVSDALADIKWNKNPDIRLNMVSYLGFPILLPDGRPFGTLCILDNKRNEYSEKIEWLMLNFRRMIESHLELIYLNQVLGDQNKRLSDYLTELQALRGMVSICSYCKRIKDSRGNWHPVEHYLIQQAKVEFSHGICPECKSKL